MRRVDAPFTVFIERTADYRERVLAEMLREDCLRYIGTLAPLLLRYGVLKTPFTRLTRTDPCRYSEGYLPESVEKMQREAAMELRELRVRLHSRWSFAWAVKKAE